MCYESYFQTYTYDKIMDFTNFNNLISFGCSPTWGACMSDIFDSRISMAYKDTKENFTPSNTLGAILLHPYVYILIIRLRQEHPIDRYILYKILNYDYNKDVVCVLWSCYTQAHCI